VASADLIVTAALGGAGIAGTLVAPLLSARKAKSESLRQERLKLYADALAHAITIERRLDAVWASDGEHSINISPSPTGGALPLAPIDAITVRRRLVANRRVEGAWAELVSVWESLLWWGANEAGGAPDETPPDGLEERLRAASVKLSQACKQDMR